MLVIGSRGSALALWQARHIESRLATLGFASRIEVIRTTGDKITDVALAQLGAVTGTKGLFTKEIDEALLAGSIDLAVHSLKDVPADLPAGLVLAAIPAREDPRDALVGVKLRDLPQRARVGTSSLRRAAQLHAARPDLAIESLRGNLDTRLRKLDEGRYDAIVLAAAGLRRLGWAERITELLDVDVMCPAVGQGALAVETRADAGAGAKACASLDDRDSRLAVTAERALLRALGGGCQVPFGAHAEVSHDEIRIRAVIASPDGQHLIRRDATEPRPSGSGLSTADQLGTRLGHDLLEAGGREILDAVYGAA